MHTNQEVAQMARAHMSAQFGTAHGWKKAAARKYDISCSLMTKFLQGKTPPPGALLEAMGLQKITAYVPIEAKETK